MVTTKTSHHLNPKLLLLLGLICQLILQACQVPPNQGQGQGQGQNLPRLDDQVVGNIVEGIQELSTEFNELTRPNQVEAWVSSLIIKQQPGKDMPQIGTLKEGERAEYLYQRTVRKTEFTLRGQRYLEPWILIKTQAGMMGWVHEGGVKFVGPNLQNLLGGGPASNTNPAARTRGVNGSSSLNPAQNFLVVPGSRVGPITVNTSEMELVQMYGAASVGRATVEAPEKGQIPCTVVMPGTKDEIRIVWKDDSRSKVKEVYFLRADSRWYTRQGLTVGLPLTELTKANKAPLNFYGFNWAYSGTVSSFRKGALSAYEKYCYVVLRPSSSSSAKLQKKFNGNQVFSSNHPELPPLNLYVQQFVVYLD